MLQRTDVWRISPQGIGAHGFHEVVGAGFCDYLHTSRDASIGEEDVEPAILLQYFVDEVLDIRFLAGVDLAGVHFNTRVQTLDFPRVDV